MKYFDGSYKVLIGNNNDNVIYKDFENYAFIRELHVYGNVVPVGYKKEGDTQHKGVGKQLLKLAEEQAFKDNCRGTAVISGIGVKEYYRKRGYFDKETYMVKHFS
mgnify:CR=1 FL=1